MNILQSYFDDFVGLFFPVLCAACGTNLFKHETEICISCTYHLPYTNHHNDPDNGVARQLWGRFQFEQAGAFVHFEKGNKVQRLMHQLKYNNRPEAGRRLGRLYGSELSRKEWVRPDVVIPVPLHPKKQRQRSYNQSEYIAQGLAEGLDVSLMSNNLCRAENTDTQTRKSRYARYENLKEAFQIRDAAALENKHVLLVDDVMTTGATLEACAVELLKLENVRISVAVLAFAE